MQQRTSVRRAPRQIAAIWSTRQLLCGVLEHMHCMHALMQHICDHYIGGMFTIDMIAGERRKTFELCGYSLGKSAGSTYSQSVIA